MRIALVAQRFVMITIGFCGAFILIELLLRLWTPEAISWKAVRRSDRVLHHSLNASARYLLKTPEFEVEVKTNSMGLRDHEYVPSKKNEFKIIILGDSFVEGYGVRLDSCFVKRLEVQLNARASHSTKYVVFNFGVAGYSPLLEYLFFRDKGLPLKPQLVILCYDMTDVQEDVLYARDATFDANGIPLAVLPSQPSFGSARWFPQGALKTYIQNYSYLYALVAPFIMSAKGRPLFEPGNINAGRFVHTIDSSAARWSAYFDESESYVKLTRDLCRKESITFLLAVHPRGHQVSSTEWREGRKYWGLEPRVYNSAIFESLEEFSQRNRILFLNMTATFRRRSNGALYYPIDGHWTNAGHRVAADTLFDFLLDQKLVNDIGL